MGEQNTQQKTKHDTPPAPEPQPMPPVLPCGGRGCSYCHDGCRADRRPDRDENQQVEERAH